MSKFEAENKYISMKGMFDTYTKFLVKRLFSSIINYKFSVKGKKRKRRSSIGELELIKEEDDYDFDNSNLGTEQDTEYMN